MVNWIGLAFPFLYLGILVGSLATFSSLYRRRKASKASHLEPWFNRHLSRDVYLSLLHIEPQPGQPKVPDSVLKAALLRRATEDILRIIQIRNSKQALSTLLQRGSVGDELWQRFLRAEKEIEEEVRDVVSEANAFAPNWGQHIFQSANEMATNQMVRKKIDELQSQTKTEKEWWDKKKANVQAEFMKELETEHTLASPTPKTSTTGGPTGKGSDDDAVMVEGGGPAERAQGGGGKKKKKGKH